MVEEGKNQENIGDIFKQFMNKEFQENLSEEQMLFANLIYKTDFTKQEISEFLKWEPSSKEFDEIIERVEYWRSLK